MALIALATSFAACRPRTEPPPAPRETPIRAGLLIVELPAIDFSNGGRRAPEQGSPAHALGRAIPRAEFAVRVEAAIPATMKGPPKVGVLFFVYQRLSSGRLGAMASAPLAPIASDRKGVMIYEGTCPGTRLRRGDAVIEVNYRDKSYLVRTARVE